jgi:hypothetical protein
LIVDAGADTHRRRFFPETAMIRGNLFHRGAALTSTGIVLAVLGAAAVGLVIIRPQFAFGPSQAAATAPAISSAQRALLLRVEELLRTSKAVLAVHPRGSDPFEEMVIWLDDTENPGVLDRRELALLSHSRIMRTLTLFMTAASVKAGSAIEPEAASRQGFCNLWRSEPGVVGVVIATDIADLRCVPSGVTSQEQANWRVELIWEEKSADGPSAAASIDAVAVHPPTRE